MNRKWRTTLPLFLLVAHGVHAAQQTRTKAQEAFEQAMAATGGDHQRLLVQAANAGSLPAAARLLEVRETDALKQFDPTAPMVQKWRTSDEIVNGMSARQVLGGLIMLSQEGVEEGKLKRQLECRDLIASAPVTHPKLAVIWAWSLENLEPKDTARAETVRGTIADSYVRYALNQDPLARANSFFRAGIYQVTAAHKLDREALASGAPPEASTRVANAWSAARELLDRAAALFEQGLDYEGQGVALRYHASILSKSPLNAEGRPGHPQRILELCELSAAAYERSGMLAKQADMLAQAGWSAIEFLGLVENSKRNYDKPFAIYARAAIVAEKANAFDVLATCLRQQAFCLSPPIGPEREHQRVAELLERAAQAYTKGGDAKSAAEMLKAARYRRELAAGRKK